MQQGNTPQNIRKNRTKSPGLTTRHSGLWLGVMFVLMAELFVYTAARVDATHKEFEIARIKKTRNQAIAYQKELILEHDRLCSPDRISTLAEKRLGLARPSRDRVIYLEASGDVSPGPVPATGPGPSVAAPEGAN